GAAVTTEPGGRLVARNDVWGPGPCRTRTPDGVGGAPVRRGGSAAALVAAPVPALLEALHEAGVAPGGGRLALPAGGHRPHRRALRLGDGEHDAAEHRHEPEDAEPDERAGDAADQHAETCQHEQRPESETTAGVALLGGEGAHQPRVGAELLLHLAEHPLLILRERHRSSDPEKVGALLGRATTAQFRSPPRRGKADERARLVTSRPGRPPTVRGATPGRAPRVRNAGGCCPSPPPRPAAGRPRRAAAGPPRRRAGAARPARRGAGRRRRGPGRRRAGRGPR